MAYQAIDLGEFWADLNKQLIELVGLVPAAQLVWSPAPGEWSALQLVAHVAGARYHWMANSVGDGHPVPASLNRVAGHQGLREHLTGSWERIAAFISSPALLDARYGSPPNDPEYADPGRFDGHYIAYHRLAHDIHHRAGLLDRMAQMDIDIPPGRQRRPL